MGTARFSSYLWLITTFFSDLQIIDLVANRKKMCKKTKHLNKNNFHHRNQQLVLAQGQLGEAWDCKIIISMFIVTQYGIPIKSNVLRIFFKYIFLILSFYVNKNCKYAWKKWLALPAPISKYLWILQVHMRNDNSLLLLSFSYFFQQWSQYPCRMVGHHRTQMPSAGRYYSSVRIFSLVKLPRQLC